MKLQGKVALITGGNSGIGLETARLFVAEGARVAVIGRNSETLQEARELLGPEAVMLREDITNYEGLRNAVAQAVHQLGNLDIVFANAGIVAPTPLVQGSIEDFEQILKTNVVSAFSTIQACEPYLNDYASVILNSSVSSHNGRPGFSAYAASKGAVRAMAKSIASELSHRHIRVNVITPGSAKTPLIQELVESNAEAYEELTSAIPLGRLSHPAEIAKAVLFLASDDSSFVHAAELIVDDGSTGAPLGAPRYRRNREATLAERE